MTTTQFLPIDKVHPNPKQPRKVFKKASLLELAQSIKEHGQIEPIIVEADKDGWLLVAGERRWRAHQLAGKKTIEAVIRLKSNHNGREILLSGIIENIQREEMNAIDEALAYEQLNTVHHMSANKIAAKIGTNSKRIYDRLNLLKLDKRVQKLIRDEEFTCDSRVTLALINITNGNLQYELVQRAVKGGLKIKTILMAAARISEALGANPIGMRKNGIRKEQTPALVLARRPEKNLKDEEHKPPKWDALKQIGKVPAWSLVVASAKKTCAECELRDMANESTCGRCPLVMVLESLMEGVK